MIRNAIRVIGSTIISPHWLNVYIGLYLTTLPFLFAFPTTNSLIAVHMSVAGLIAVVAAASAVSKYPGLGLINVPVGLFMLGLPLLFGYAAFTTVLVQCLALGLIVAVVAVAGEVGTQAIEMARPSKIEKEETGPRRVA